MEKTSIRLPDSWEYCMRLQPDTVSNDYRGGFEAGVKAVFETITVYNPGVELKFVPYPEMIEELRARVAEKKGRA